MEEGSTLSFLSSSAARRFGDRAAIDGLDGKPIGFAELDDRAARVASGLVELGLSPGDRVVLCLPNVWQWAAAYHAIIKLGGIVVPVNALLTVPELEFVIADTETTVAIVEPSRAEGLDKTKCRLVTLQEMGGATSFETLLDRPPLTPLPAKPDALLSIGYTSGTTGKPKGAMLSHGNVAACLHGTVDMHARKETDVVYSALPFPHVYGNIVLGSIFVTGARLIAPRRFKAEDAIAAIARHKVTLFEGVPTMYYQMLGHPSLAEADLTSLTRVTVGGQTMPPSTIDAVVERFGCPMLELWGMTEVSGPFITHRPEWPRRHGSIGRPMPGSQARIADLALKPCAVPTGTPGRLIVRGPTVMTGYWRNPDATRDALDSDGWLETGDVAFADDEGYLTIVDRQKDMILTAGYNIYPAEVEQVLAQHPSVSMVAVGGIGNEEKGELAHAFVVLKAGASRDADGLLQHCRARLAAYKVPRAIHFVDDLPKTSTGKIMRRDLHKLANETAGVS